MKKHLNITFPIVKSYESENYPLMIVDSAGVTHYWNFDGSYDGYSQDCDGCYSDKDDICLN